MNSIQINARYSNEGKFHNKSFNKCLECHLSSFYVNELFNIYLLCMLSSLDGNEEEEGTSDDFLRVKDWSFKEQHFKKLLCLLIAKRNYVWEF